jgi:hypothetical protein
MRPEGMNAISVSLGMSAAYTVAPRVHVTPSGDEKSATVVSPSSYAAL